MAKILSDSTRRSFWPAVFAGIRTLAILGILVALFLIYERLGAIRRLQNEQLIPRIADGPPPNSAGDGSTLKQVSLERIPDAEALSLDEARPLLHGEWIHVSRYSERFQSATVNGKQSMTRTAVWVHIPSRTKLTLTYETPRGSQPSR